MLCYYLKQTIEANLFHHMNDILPIPAKVRQSSQITVGIDRQMSELIRTVILIDKILDCL